MAEIAMSILVGGTYTVLCVLVGVVLGWKLAMKVISMS